MMKWNYDFAPRQMDPEFKERWCAALRSDKYDQGTSGYLKVGSRYCCLGVAVELLGRMQEEPDMVTSHPATSIPGLGYEEEQFLADGLNDQGVPFSLIADWIEKNL